MPKFSYYGPPPYFAFGRLITGFPFSRIPVMEGTSLSMQLRKIHKRYRARSQQRSGGLLRMICHLLKPPCRRFLFLLSRGQHSHLMADSMTTPSAPRQRRPFLHGGAFAPCSLAQLLHTLV